MKRGELELYIENQVKSGYTKDQITEYLLKYGHNLKELETCFDNIHSEEEKTIKFVKDHLKTGFTIQEITAHLTKYGVSENSIHNSIIKAISKKESSFHFSIDEFIKTEYFKYAIPAVFTILFIGLFIGLFSNLGEQKLLDVKVSVLNEYARAGEDLKININAQNFGKKRRFDITAKIELVGTKVKYEETFAIETSVSKQINIPLPLNLEDDDYTLRTTLNYGGESEATSSLHFHINKARIVNQENEIAVETEIIEEELISEINISNEQQQINITQNESIDKKNHLNNATNTTHSELNTSEDRTEEPNENTLEINTDISHYDLAIDNQTSEECYFIQETELKDDCYMDISKDLNSKKSCFNITSIETKDACFVQIASMGDASACEEVTAPQFQRMCADIILNLNN